MAIVKQPQSITSRKAVFREVLASVWSMIGPVRCSQSAVEAFGATGMRSSIGMRSAKSHRRARRMSHDRRRCRGRRDADVMADATSDISSARERWSDEADGADRASPPVLVSAAA